MRRPLRIDLLLTALGGALAGGLLVWRGLVFEINDGQTISPLDSTFSLLGGGPSGSIGEMASWALGILACVVIVLTLVRSRRQRRKYDFQMRPMWAEFALGLFGCLAVLAAIVVVNSYPWPEQLARQFAEAQGSHGRRAG